MEPSLREAGSGLGSEFVVRLPAVGFDYHLVMPAVFTELQARRRACRN